jgi:hypothetical protein
MFISFAIFADWVCVGAQEELQDHDVRDVGADGQPDGRALHDPTRRHRPRHEHHRLEGCRGENHESRLLQDGYAVSTGEAVN